MKGEVQLEASDGQAVADTESAPLLQPPTIVSAEKDCEINDEESDTSSAACCRICLELEGCDQGDELISPCMCKGTQQFVHRSCLDHWRSVKEGFAFSHCTTCKAQFHLRTEIPEDYSWRKLKFRIFVARDVLLVFLAVQTVASSPSAERNWGTYSFIHSVNRNKLGAKKAEDLVFVHSNLRLFTHKQEGYKHGETKCWDVDPETPNLDASIAHLSLIDLELEGKLHEGASKSGTACGSNEPQESSIDPQDSFGAHNDVIGDQDDYFHYNDYVD